MLMHSSYIFLASLLAASTKLAAADCSEYQASHSFDGVPISMSYLVNEGIFSAEIVYEGQGYVAWGLSPNGAMAPSAAVIGLPDSPQQVQEYFLAGYSSSQVQLAEEQSLLSSSLTQNETHTVMTFSKLIQDQTDPIMNADGTTNYFLVAAGSSNSLGYHQHRASVSLVLQPCESQQLEADAEAEAATQQPVTEEPQEESEAELQCDQYQYTQQVEGTPLTLHYGITQESVLSAQVVYEGQGYVAWAVSPSGTMTGSIAVIGLPDAQQVAEYSLRGYSVSSVTLLDEQYLLTSSIAQNDTHTVLEFSMDLQASGREVQAIADGETTNYILLAAGSSNNLGFHSYRTSLGLTLQKCQPGAPQSSLDMAESEAVRVEIDNKQALFKAHGWISAIAWGILAPLAISSSFCRHLIPKAGLWFQIHFYANVLVLVFTITAFALVYKAVQATEGGNHFQSSPGALGNHKPIGLALFIAVILQAIGGMVRPAGGADKTTLRALWEVAHKGSGLVLLALGFYQCHSGLVLYANRFVQDEDYVFVFWIVAGIIMGIGAIGKLHKELIFQVLDTETSSMKPEVTEGPPTQPDSRKFEREDSDSA